MELGDSTRESPGGLWHMRLPASPSRGSDLVGLGEQPRHWLLFEVPRWFQSARGENPCRHRGTEAPPSHVTPWPQSCQFPSSQRWHVLIPPPQGPRRREMLEEPWLSVLWSVLKPGELYKHSYSITKRSSLSDCKRALTFLFFHC